MTSTPLLKNKYYDNYFRGGPLLPPSLTMATYTKNKKNIFFLFFFYIFCTTKAGRLYKFSRT